MDFPIFMAKQNVIYFKFKAYIVYYFFWKKKIFVYLCSHLHELRMKVSLKNTIN